MMIEGLSRLAPDSGAGRFVESMNEATQRIEKDKSDHIPVIISQATSSGDANVRDRDVKQIFDRVQKRPTTVHVILLNSTAGSATGGANQTQVGLAVTQATRGRYESIAVGAPRATRRPENRLQRATRSRATSSRSRSNVRQGSPERWGN
jgi:hypothetical protein